MRQIEIEEDSGSAADGSLMTLTRNSRIDPAAGSFFQKELPTGLRNSDGKRRRRTPSNSVSTSIYHNIVTRKEETPWQHRKL